MTEHICKVCGGLMSYMILTCMPPIHRYVCMNCDRRVDEQEGIERVEK